MIIQISEIFEYSIEEELYQFYEIVKLRWNKALLIN